LLAASDVPFAPVDAGAEPVDPAASGEVREDVVAAATRAAAAGFDLLFLDLSHGSLFATFLSPGRTAARTSSADPWRTVMRFPAGDRGRGARSGPDDRPLGARLTADDRLPGGLGLDDAVAIARRCRSAAWT
jgi:anthraniloyl-CoA monooxygenase